LHRAFEQALKRFGDPAGWTDEFNFHRDRGWRFDWAHPGSKAAIELQGGVYTQGRHTRGQGYERDAEKLNAAQLLGWKVFYVTSGMLRRDPKGLVEMVMAAVAENGI